MMNLTFFTYLKILTIIFLIIIHIYLIFKEMEIINSELNTEKYKMAGILNNFTRNLKTALAITIGTTTLLDNSMTIYEHTKNKELMEQEKALSESKKKESKEDLIISSPMENYEALDLLGKIAVGFLLLNYALFNCFITLVFILYGNFLIEKFDLESRYPKLVTWINLRKKFQRYFLIFSLSGIGVIILIQFTFWFFILSLHH